MSQENVVRQRLLSDMLAAGQIIVTRAARTKAPWFRLTATEEARARALAGLPSLANSFSWLERLAELAGNSGKWIWEGCFSDQYSTAEVAATCHMALPSLCRGWARTNSMITGVAAYSITAAGIEALTNPPVDEDPADIGTDAACDHYLAALDIRRERLSTDAVIDPREIGPVPLSQELIAGLRETPKAAAVPVVEPQLI